MVGPIPDIEFLGLVDRGEIDRESVVQSPELTNNQAIAAGRVNISAIREMVNQRTAEEQRLRNVQSRENQRDSKNREILLHGIKKAISDGHLTLNERAQLNSFASKAGIPLSEVEEVLKQESKLLLDQIVEEVISDGFFDDQENERICKIAVGLGLPLEFSKDQQFRLKLAQVAWDLLQQLGSGRLPETLEINSVEVFEIVTLKRPSGIPLGDDHYLKSVGAGQFRRIEKSLLFESRLTVKKFALTSIVDAQWYSDGLFLKRSSGKSLFIRPEKFGLEWNQFAMTMKVLTTDAPVVVACSPKTDP